MGYLDTQGVTMGHFFFECYDRIFLPSVAFLNVRYRGSVTERVSR